jgi:hypothetical protein
MRPVSRSRTRPVSEAVSRRGQRLRTRRSMLSQATLLQSGLPGALSAARRSPSAAGLDACLAASYRRTRWHPWRLPSWRCHNGRRIRHDRHRGGPPAVRLGSEGPPDTPTSVGEWTGVGLHGWHGSQACDPFRGPALRRGLFRSLRFGDDPVEIRGVSSGHRKREHAWNVVRVFALDALDDCWDQVEPGV